MARHALPVTALVAVSVLAIACGSAKQPTGTQPSSPTPTPPSTTSTQPPTSTPTTPATPASTRSCATSDLKVWLERDRGGGTAGTFHYLLEFKNVSDHSCQMYGFPGVSAYLNGHQVGSAASREASQPKRTVTLQPGATAHATLPIVNAGNYPAELCGMVTATSLKVYPPNETVATYVPYRFAACLLTGAHVLGVWPVEAGPGTPEGEVVLSSNVTMNWQWPNLRGSPYAVHHSYPVPPLPVLRAISVGQHEDSPPAYDRISFTFTGTFPSYDLFYVPGLTADPSGKPVSIEGDAVLRIRFNQADAHDASGRSTVQAAPSRHVGYQSVAGYAQAGDFEGVVTYGVGSFRIVPNVQPQVRAVEVKKTDGLGGVLYIVAFDIQTTGLGNPT